MVGTTDLLRMRLRLDHCRRHYLGVDLVLYPHIVDATSRNLNGLSPSMGVVQAKILWMMRCNQ